MRHPLSSNYIFVGIGHAGGKILCNLKQRFYEEVIFENEEKEIPVSFLYIDSSDDLISKDDSNASGGYLHAKEIVSFLMEERYNLFQLHSKVETIISWNLPKILF